MTEILTHERVRSAFPALAEAARFVGSVQIRNRATLAGNMCNASPAADTAPPLLVYDARLVVAGPDGGRRIPLDDFFVRSGVTALRRGELVTAIELPLPDDKVGSAFQRRTRRRGHDLASVTLAVAVRADGRLRLAYGSLGPRPLVFEGSEADIESVVRPRRAVSHLDARRTRLSAGDAARPGRPGARRRAQPRGRRMINIKLSLNGQQSRSLGRSPSHAARGAARRHRPDGHQGVLSRRGVRSVHRSPERRDRRLVPGARGRGGRRRSSDRRGTGRRAARSARCRMRF